MGLKTRLGKLEPAAIAAWREDWERLAQIVRDNTPQSVNDRLEQAFDEHRAELDNHMPTGRAAEEVLEALEGVDLAGLDVYALSTWFYVFNLPELDDKPNLRLTPAAIPWPPDEPAGVCQTLEALLPDPDERGEAAACLLYILAAGRAVREYSREP